MTQFTLTPAVAEQAAALASLLAAAYRLPVEASGRRQMGDAEVIERVALTVSPEFGLADWALMRLAPDETLTPAQYGFLDATERILRRLTAMPHCHPQYATLLMQYRGTFAAAAIPADGWITNPQHPARRMLAALHTIGLGWHPELATAAMSTRGQIEGWLTGLRGDLRAWDQAATRATQWIDDERKRAERVEKRLIETEAGQMRDRRARQLAARTLNQALADRLIGREVAEMLVQDWLKAMHTTLLREGEQGPLWQRLKRITGTLRWTLSPELGDEARNKLLRLVGQVTDDVNELAPQLFPDPAHRDRVTGALEQEHLYIVRNLPRETVMFEPIDTLDTLADVGVAASESLLTRVRAMAVGSWLLLHDGTGNSRRARILLRDDGSSQLLLVNALGVKVQTFTYEKIAVRLADGSVEVLPTELPMKAAFEAVIAELREMQQRNQQSRIEQLRVAREQAAADARAKEAARQKAMAEAAALEQARQEAQRRVEHAQREAAVVRQQAEDDARAGAQRARLLASSLTIGAWLVFRDDNGTVERRRLTVVLPSSGKYIFVDAAGTGKREINRDELIRRLGDGSITPVSKDQKLDDSLSRVVGNLRGDRGNPQGGTP